MIERRILYFSEVIQFFRLKWIRVLIAGACAFALTFSLAYLLIKPHYRATATFKQAHRGMGEDAGFVQVFLKSMQGISEESGAAGIMQSKTLLAKAAKAVGLQAGIWGFLDADFQLGESFSFTLIPIDELRYEVVGFGEGKLGKPFLADGVHWTLCEMPTEPISVKWIPMRELLGEIEKHLKVKSSRIDPQLLNLTFGHQDRKLAIGFLNELMEKFTDHLEQEHERISCAQIAYLQKRRDQLSDELDIAFDEHATYLQSAGNIDLTQELQMLCEPKETYLAKKHQLDLELKKWNAEKLETTADRPWREGYAKLDKLSTKQAMIVGNPAQFEEYIGIDLKLAETLFDASASERDQLTQELLKIERVLEKMDQENFAIGNLGRMLQDPVSLSIVTKASELILQLADKDNYTTRELRAKAEALHTQKLYLKDHIERQKTALIDRIDLICDKLEKLRITALDLIERERSNVELKLMELGEQMHEVPAKWRRESELKVKRKLTMQIMEGISQLSESKVINHHLFHVKSGTLDQADSPLFPQSRHLFLLSSIGGVSGAFFYLLFVLVLGVSKGLPVSRAYLLEKGYHTIEEPARLEKLALQIQPDEVVALIGIDFADELSKVLKNQGYIVSSEKMPSSALRFEKRQGCNLVLCEGEKEAVGSILFADRFVIKVSGKKPEDLEIFPKHQSHFIL